MRLKLSAAGDRRVVNSPADTLKVMSDEAYYAIPRHVRDFTEGRFQPIPARSVKSFIKRQTIPGIKLKGL